MKLDVEIIEEAIARFNAVGSYTCHRIADVLKDLDLDWQEHEYLVAYTAFTAKRLGCRVDPDDATTMDYSFGNTQWWAEARPFSKERLANLEAFKAAIENGEVE